MWPFTRNKPKATAAAVAANDQAVVAFRRFQAATLDRLTASWSVTPVSVDSELTRDLTACVARARDLAKNDDYVRRYLSLVKNNVVGPKGIELVSEPRSPGGKLDVGAAEAIEQAWLLWGKKGHCDATGTMSWLDVQNQVARAWRRDGEAIIKLLPGFAASPDRFAVQVIDSLQLDVRLNQKVNDTAEIVMGVEVDPLRRPIAYHFHTDERSPITGSYLDGRPRVRVPAAEIIHIYDPEFINQTRGFPSLVSVMRRLQMLDGYEEATLVAARVAAATSIVFTRNEENRGYEGPTADDGSTSGKRTIEAEPGMMFELPYAATAHQFKAEQPTTTMSAAIKTWLRGAASGLNVSYNALASDLEGVNYSSIRQGVLDDRDQWMSDQDFIARHLHQPVFEAWLRVQLLRGSIRTNSRPLAPERLDKFCQCQWQGRRWRWVDPAKDQSADIAGIEAGLRSPLDSIREQGYRPRKVVEDLERWQTMRSDAGIEPPPPPTPATVASAGSAPPPRDEDADNDESND